MKIIFPIVFGIFHKIKTRQAKKYTNKYIHGKYDHVIELNDARIYIQQNGLTIEDLFVQRRLQWDISRRFITLQGYTPDLHEALLNSDRLYWSDEKLLADLILANGQQKEMRERNRKKNEDTKANPVTKVNKLAIRLWNRPNRIETCFVQVVNSGLLVTILTNQLINFYISIFSSLRNVSTFPKTLICQSVLQ